MKILSQGCGGFVGSPLWLAISWSLTKESRSWDSTISPRGKRNHRLSLKRLGVNLVHGDLRMASDVDGPSRRGLGDRRCGGSSVLAGRDANQRGASSSNTIFSAPSICSNSAATRAPASFWISTSRVYSIPVLAKLPLIGEAGKIRTRRVAPLAAGSQCGRPH